jgi:4-hydroxy-4-methyl-2-oxoglutarate aldolase
MRFGVRMLLIIGIVSLFTVALQAQPLSMTPEEIIKYSPAWTGERLPDGRPKVSDDILARMKYVSITEAWAFLGSASDPQPAGGGGGRGGFGGGGRGYNNQYTGDNWKIMHEDVTIVGRALTIQFLPTRPDVNGVTQQEGNIAGRSSGQYTWGIDQLQKGDCYVANVCNAVLDASHVGDNLGNAIWSKSGNGAIIWGTLRDLDGNASLKGFNVFVRDFRPQSNANNMVGGINCPLQLGYVTIMPGDVVLAKRDGVVFIPSQHAERLVLSSERTRLQDTFAHIGVREGRFTAQQADGGFTQAMNAEYTQWLKTNRTNMKKFFEDPAEVPPQSVIDDIIKEREGGNAPRGN